MKKVLALLMVLSCATAFAAPAVQSYISFEDTNFGGAIYIDDQVGVTSTGYEAPVAGEINLVDGGILGKFGEFVTNGWWAHGGDSLAVPSPENGGSIVMWARFASDGVLNKYPLLWDSAPEGCTMGWKAYSSSSTNNTADPFNIIARVNNDAWVAATITDVVAETWFHYAFTWEDNGDDTYDIAVYKDGVLAQSAQDKTITEMDDVIRIAGGGLNLGHSKWQGDIDEVYVFDSAISATDVANIYSTTNTAMRVMQPQPYAGTDIKSVGDLTLSWAAPTGATVDTSYEVYFSDGDPDFTGVMPVSTTATSTIVNISTNGPKYWRVDVNDGVDTYEGLVFFIDTDFSAYDPSPADEETVTDPSFELSWTCGLPSVSYDVYVTDVVDAETNEPNFASVTPVTTTSNSVTVSVDNLKTYYWRVDVIDGSNVYESDVWSFDTLFAIDRPVALAHISFEDEDFGGAEYIDDASDAAGDIQVVTGGALGNAGEFTNPSAGGDSLALPYVTDGSGTVSTYIKVPDFTSYPTIFSYSATTAHEWKFYLVDTGYISPRFSGWDAGTLVDIDNQWFHFAIAWERNNTIVDYTIYIDGVAAVTDAQSWVDPGETVYAGGGSWYPRFVGQMDEFYAFNRAMTADEVAALYANADKRAYDPKPYCGAGYPLNGILSWAAPAGVASPTYNVYLSTDRTFFGTTPISTTSTSLDVTSSLAFDAEYYWKVDVIDGATTYDGIVWSFNTALSVGDFNENGAVDLADFATIAENWNDTTETAPEIPLVADDFDSYFPIYAGEPNMSTVSNWYVRPGYDYPSNGTKSLDIQADDRGAGMVMRLDYDFTGAADDDWAIAEFIFEFDTPMDLSQYDRFEFDYNCLAGNSKEDHFTLKLITGSISGYDQGNPLFQIDKPDGSTAQVPGWVTYSYDLSESGADLTDVYGLLIGCSTWPNDLYFEDEGDERGTGTILYDNIKFVKNRICSGDQEGDLNGDCTVNIEDLTIFANNWLN